jgi:virulence factor Mce-like protein
MTRRVIAIAAALVAAGVVLVLGLGAGQDQSGSYQVRAIFNNAFTIIAGEDVKISGVKVGKIASLGVTPDNKAAVVLDISEPGFKDFRKDATCTIRPQSLIGERYVECTPTQPRPEGSSPAPKLDKITQGDGKGQYLLPASQTFKPIDIDLVGNIMRMPYRQRLSIIVNELGTGLAANGDELRQAIRAANPALEQTDKVLKILASQNQTLADLARNGDQALRPLARDRAKVADFVVQANTTAQATAERRTDLERNLQKFPAFLRELKPTLQRLGGLADQMTPVLTDLGAAAPDINRFLKQLGPFSQAGIPAVKSLGDASDVGHQALIKSKPLIGDLRSFAGEARPTTKNLSSLLTSFRDTGGIERLMDFIFYQGTATNGYDSIGHYLRAVFVLTTCTTYSEKPVPNCFAFFQKPTNNATSARAAKSSTPTLASVNREIANGRSPFLARQDAVVKGLDPAVFDQSSNNKDKSKNGTSGASSPTAAGPRINLPAALFPGQPAGGSGGSAGSTGQAPAPAATSPTDPGAAPAASSATPPGAGGSGSGSGGSGSGSGDPTTTLLDYLLGG